MREQHAEAVQALLGMKDVNKNWAADDGVTPLCVAAGCGDAPVVKLLLEAGAAKNTPKQSNGATPLLLAGHISYAVFFRMVLNFGMLHSACLHK